MTNLDLGPVEDNALPYKYRKHGKQYSHFDLILRYEELKKDYKYALDRISNAQRRVNSIEKRYETEVELNVALRNENARLYEAGRYALYGKPEPEPDDDFSTVDEEAEEEQDGGVAKL